MTDTLKCIINMSSHSLNQEILRFFHFHTNAPSASAFIQQRAKIKLDAFYQTLYRFNQTFPCKKKHGYTFLACDETDILLPLPQNGDKTYASYRGGKNTRDFYQIHMHALFDLVSQRYLDAILEPPRGVHEQTALKQMLKRGTFASDTVLITDRGYEGYDLFALMSSMGLKFVCRAKDGNPGGIIKGFGLPKDGEYDRVFDRIYTMSNSKEVRSHPEIYHRIRNNPSARSVFLTKENREYRMYLRILRIKVGDGYECIVTNLKPEEFTLSEIKDIYWMRWGIETSFRELKYTIGLNNFHSKKVEFIKQEILARMILYNFCQIIIKTISLPQKDRKYIYEINTAVAACICRKFLFSDEFHMDAEALIRRYISPVRPDRMCRRKVRYHSAVGFTYRAI